MKNVRRSSFGRKWALGSIAILLVSLLVLSGLVSAQSSYEGIVVTVFSDEDKKNDGECSLREAIIAANSDKQSGGKGDECQPNPAGGADTILLQPGVYTLSRTDKGNEDSSQTGDLDIDSNITIVSSEADTEPSIVVIEGGEEFTDRIFHVLPGHMLTMEGVTIRHGKSRENGGGVYVEGILDLKNSTLIANNAKTNGGALYNAAGGVSTLTHVTIKDNSVQDGAGGGLFGDGGTLEVRNSLLDGNDCSGNVTAEKPEHNLAFEAPGCQNVAAAGGNPALTAINVQNEVISQPCDPIDQICDIAYYMLEASSAAIDNADNGICLDPELNLDYDQVGRDRKQGVACDIGAYEADEINTPPVAANQGVTVDEDGQQAFVLDVTDAEGNIVSTSFDLQSPQSPPAFGELTGPYGSLNMTYTPDDDFFGGDSFTYKICDSADACDTATVSITVVPVNDPPVATDDGAITGEDTAVNIDVHDNDNAGPANEDQTLITTSATLPASGLATIEADGTVNYIPNDDFYGSDSFSYEVCDGGGLCDTAAVSVTIEAVNDAPVATDDNVTTPEDTAVNIDVQDNDSAGPVGEDQTLTTTSVTTPANGTATIEADGTVTYEPALNFDGSDSFEYEVCDSEPLCVTATVGITVTPDAYIEVTNTSDEGEGSLRWAIEQANTITGLDTIIFQIGGPTSCTDETISVGSELPGIGSSLPGFNEPVIIDGTLWEDGSTRCDAPHITLTSDPTAATSFSGLTILASGQGSTIRDLIIMAFDGSGIVIGDVGAPSSGNIIEGNTIQNNGDGDTSTSGGITTDDGVTIIEGVNNQLINNNIAGNVDQAYDLGGDGETENDFGDPDTGANFVQNYPDIMRAGPNPGNNKLIIEGWLNSRPDSTYTMQFFKSSSCDSGDLVLLNDYEIEVTTDSLLPELDAGNAYFSLIMPETVGTAFAIRSTATDANGNTSELSPCVRVGVGNDTWIAALELNNGGQIVDDQYIDLFGLTRWYKIKVNPGNKVQVKLTNLPKNYDVVVYKDIYEAYEELTSPQDLNRLNAEFAADAVAPSALSPSALSPSALSPSALSPSALSPEEFAPSALSPSALSPSALSPSALSQDVISPSALSPSALSPSALSPVEYSPSALSPSALSPSALSPSALSADVYASAQMRSLIAVSAYEDTADESVAVSTWNNIGHYYVRVRGREGQFDPHIPFNLNVQIIPGDCDNLYNDAAFANLPASSPPAPVWPASVPGNLKTLILVDSARMNENYGAAEVAGVLANLNAVAGRSEVNGAVIDVGQDGRVSAANDLADQYVECPTGKNLVAESIQEIIDTYRETYPIEYIVLVGNDDILPFYRHPDNALLGPESDFSPPVLNPSASFSSLQGSMVLSQDRYGADFGISFKDDEIPVPMIPVGRLVENPLEINTMISAYLSTANGVAPTPTSTLVTGYDFLHDAAEAVQTELEAGTGVAADTLLTAPEISPLDPQSWTAPQLKELISGQRYDLMFLAGHFSANSALAADYATSMISTELPDSDEIDLTNAIIFSAGCHSGYNIVYEDRYPGRTFEPDWAQAFAQRGAVLIAGTGYQYGDTEFLQYSERIYLEFSKELRTGSGPVAIGDAFVKAKQTYLARTPQMRGIHEKSLLEATIFGFPFLKVNMPGERISDSGSTSVIAGTSGVTTEPGATLGLRFADLTVTPSLTPQSLEMRNIDEPDIQQFFSAYYLEGSDGFEINPGEPVLPLESFDVSVDNLVLRGVGFRGGSYTDLNNIQPLVAAATTELRAIHLAFVSNVFFPLRPWSVNYFDALSQQDGVTRFNVFPVQHMADDPAPNSATLRRYDEMDFRLFYSNNVTEYSCAAGEICEENVIGPNRPALAAAPTIVSVSGTAENDSVVFEANVVANPGVGVQSVWVTYTAVDEPLTDGFYGHWQSIDLAQDPEDSRVWRSAPLNLNGMPAEYLRFIVQAGGGNALVSLSDNVGRYYMPGGDVERLPTTTTLLPGASNGKVGQTAEFKAELRDNNGNLFVNQLVGFGLGQEIRIVRTDGSGVATADIPLLARPDTYQLNAWFLGNTDYAPSTAGNPRDFQIRRQNSQISLDPLQAFFGSPDEEIGIKAILEDVDGRLLAEKTVIFTLTPVDGGTVVYKAAITDLLGQARLGIANVQAGASYHVSAEFEGTVSYFSSATTDSALLVGNRPPLCANVFVETSNGKSTLWPSNNKLNGLRLDGATDPDGDALSYYFLEIFQDEDEPLGSDFDGTITNGCTEAEARAERIGGEDGRVYHVSFLVDDGNGGTCSGIARIAVDHDQSNIDAIDDGRLYNSLENDPLACSP